MRSVGRRTFVLGGIAAAGAATARAFAQSSHGDHGGLYESLQSPGRTGPPDLAARQRTFDSPAPKAADPGRWAVRVPVPVPRSEMAWAAVLEEKMHLVGGYGEQRVDRPYQHVYDPCVDRWAIAAPSLAARITSGWPCSKRGSARSGPSWSRTASPRRLLRLRRRRGRSAGGRADYGRPFREDLCLEAAAAIEARAPMATPIDPSEGAEPSLPR